ncbi:unnamed protein product [Tuber aestivum]|uniref:BTB domain-containing protein n=1 Tax=Tuber aestivum TaxID=59557 RepID=A0A292Q5X4_9PEZI|nr:unnamed protein product [Tuber aestivum]
MAMKKKRAGGSFRKSPSGTSGASGTPQTSGTRQATHTFQATQTPQATETPQATDAPQATDTPQATGTFKARSTPTAPVTSRTIPEMASKQSPPIPFDKFASSEIFTIRAGSDLQAFHVHKDLLAGLSDEMRNHVYNDMREGKVNVMDMGHVSPDTMQRFMEFCYSGDYLYAPGAENNEDPLKDKEATEALPILMAHAKLYVFAEMFNIASLKKLSGDKIITLTRLFGELEERAHGLAVVSLMEYVLDNIPATTESTDRLVKFLARYSGYLIEKIGGYPEFHLALASSAREDFFRVFCKWVKAEKEKEPWDDLG